MKLSLPALAAAATLLAAAPSPALPSERCLRLAREADALAGAAEELAPSQLRARALALLHEARELEGLEVDGAALAMPWIASSRGRLEEADGRAPIEREVSFVADRLFEACRRLAEPAAAPAAIDGPKLVEILSRPEYELRAREETLLFRVFERLRTWLRDVFLSSAEVEDVAVAFRALFLAAAALLAAALALRLARTRLRRRRREEARQAAAALTLEDPGHYELAAASALSAGDGREAIRLGLLALLATLERLRLAAPGRAATNREVAEAIPGRGGSAELSHEALQLIARYDLVWYGLAPVSAEDAGRFLEKARQVRQRASVEARARAEGR